jgi:hypothetical protein
MDRTMTHALRSAAGKARGRAAHPDDSLMCYHARSIIEPVRNARTGMANDVVNRFLGGSALSVLARLVLLSILVGVILSAIGLDPRNILSSIENLIRSVWDMGFDAVRWLWRYFLLGAILVVPIWLVVRLTRGVAGKS